MNKIRSYSAASALPAKLLQLANTCLQDGKIKPYHVQLCPTNKCNLNCPFCSCANRARKEELSFDDLCKTLSQLEKLGMKSVTITGGGEPCCHSQLDEILRLFDEKSIRIGMVTNGLLLETIRESLSFLTWCRVSFSDDRDTKKLFRILRPLIHDNVNVDWAFSYVATRDFDVYKFMEIVEFANCHNMTHVRLVSDLLDLANIPDFEAVSKFLKAKGVDDSKVIYQDRQQYTRGLEECRISLLKPVIAPDGYVYPCCGVQYAIPETQGDFPASMRMCHITEIDEYFSGQKVFDGSICSKCYYQDYNVALDALVGRYEHLHFV